MSSSAHIKHKTLIKEFDYNGVENNKLVSEDSMFFLQ